MEDDNNTRFDVYLFATDANVVRIAVRAITFGAFAPKNFTVATETAARFHVHPRRSLHRDNLLVLHDTIISNVSQNINKIQNQHHVAKRRRQRPIHSTSLKFYVTDTLNY